MGLMYPRTVKVRSKSGTVNEYVRVVEAYREGGKVKQRVVADLGRKDLLLEVLPKLRRLLTGADRDPADPQFGEAPDWGPVLVVRALFDQLGLWGILDRYLGQAKGVPFADRAFVLIAKPKFQGRNWGIPIAGNYLCQIQFPVSGYILINRSASACSASASVTWKNVVCLGSPATTQLLRQRVPR